MGRIVVTGGGGYLGGHLVDLLVMKGHEVLIVDPLLYGDRVITGLADHPSVTCLKESANSPFALARAFRNADAVVHLAALVGEPACKASPLRTLLTNYLSVFPLMAMARQAKIGRILFTSSCSVYEYSNGAPAPLEEDVPLAPRSLYARTRLMSERALFRQTAIPATVLRLATLCGWSARMRFDLVANHMTLSAVRRGMVRVIDGHRYRPLLHVRDAARALVLALDAPLPCVQHQVFNVGANRLNYQLRELGRIVQDAVPSAHVEEIDANPDQKGYTVDFTKVQQGLAFDPERSVSASVTEVREHIFEQRHNHWEESQYYNVRRRRFTDRRSGSALVSGPHQPQNPKR